MSIDIAAIVPSRRDFLQAIATQKKRLALVAIVEGPDDARKLAEAGVAAFAVLAPGDAMRAVSEAIGRAPLLCMTAVGTAEDALVARASGADAIVVALRAAADWTVLAGAAATTHMAGLAAATDPASAELAATTAARAVYLKVDALSDVGAAVAKLGSRSVLAHLPSADEKALRALRGLVDAAIVESDLYLSTSFESLREELDP